MKEQSYLVSEPTKLFERLSWRNAADHRVTLPGLGCHGRGGKASSRDQGVGVISASSLGQDRNATTLVGDLEPIQVRASSDHQAGGRGHSLRRPDGRIGLRQRHSGARNYGVAVLDLDGEAPALGRSCPMAAARRSAAEAARPSAACTDAIASVDIVSSPRGRRQPPIRG